MARRRQVAQYVAAGVAVAILLMLAAVLMITNTDWGRERVRGWALDFLRDNTDGEVRIGRIEGNLLRRLTLIDVSITDEQGRPFLAADTISARLALRGLLRRHVILSDMRLVSAHVVIDEPPGEDWNYNRIFRIDTDPDTVVRRPGWGSWVSLEDVDIVDSRVTIRSEWEPPDDLNAEERARALRRAVSGETRENVVPVGDGYQNLMDFRELNAHLVHIIPAHPDSAGIPFEVGRFAGIVQPYRPPVGLVRDMAGKFRLAKDTLHFTDIVARLPDTRLTAAGTYALSTGDLILNMRSPDLAFPDLRWLYPPLPEEGGGSMDLRVEARTLATRIITRDMDLRVGNATMQGDADFTTGDTLRFGPTNVRFERVSTALIHRFLPDVELPRPGTFTGRLALQGNAYSMELDGDVVFADAAGGGDSRIIAVGELAMEPGLRFRDMRMRFDPLQSELARAFIPQIPVTGTITGFANLTGAPDGALQLDSDLTMRDRRTGISRVRARGGIVQGDELRLRNLAVQMDPLRADLIRDQLPQLPAGSTLAGRMVLDGFPSRSLRVDGDVVIDDPASGRSRVGATGAVAYGDVLRFDGMRVRLHELQADLLRPHLPDLPPGGVIAGALTLTGTTRMMQVDGEVAHRDPRLGTSEVGLRGGIGFEPQLRFADLDVRMQPLEMALVRTFAPDLPVGGTLTGTARLNGTTQRVAVSGDVVHVEDGNRSHVSGTVDYAAGGRGWAVANLQLQPLSLATLGRFVPGAGLRGTVAGTLQARGRSDDIRFTADLTAGDGGVLRGSGSLDLAGDQPRYDARFSLESFDLAAVSWRAPAATNLTGRIAAQGAGTDPAAMNASFDADLIDSAVSEMFADRVRVRGSIANGLASFDDGFIRIGTVQADVQGSFGLVAGRTGELRYSVVADSLHALAGWLPGTEAGVTPPYAEREFPAHERVDAGQPDAPRPLPLDPAAIAAVPHYAGGTRETHSLSVADIVAVVQADVADTAQARVSPRDGVMGQDSVVLPNPAAADTAVVAANPFDAVPADTAWDATGAPSLPADSLAGRLVAQGVLRGNIHQFGAEGTAEVEDLVYQGSRVGQGRVEYAFRDVRTPQADMTIDADLHNVVAMGMAFDSVTVDGHYRGDQFGEGRASIVAFQDDAADYRADVDFMLSLERNELRLADATLRFDDVTWRTTQPGVVAWGGGGIETRNLELVSSAGGRVAIDGTLPIEGSGDARIVIEDLELAQLSTLLQTEGELAGTLNADLRVAGTQSDPRIEGTASLADGVIDGAAVPDATLAIEYADRSLRADTELVHEGRVLATANAVLPIDLALRGAATRRLPGVISVDIRADSIPADVLPAFTDQVDEITGRLAGDISIRGTFDAPVLDGYIDLDLGEARVVPLGVKFTDISGRVTMAGNQMRVDSIVALSGGPLRIDGVIGLDQLTDPAFDLAVTATESRVINTDNANLYIDADIEVTGRLSALVVTGNIHTRRGVIYIPELAELGSTNVVSLDDPGTFNRMGEAFDAMRKQRVESGSPLANTRLDVGIVIERDVWLRSTEANVEIYTPPEVGPLLVAMDGLGGDISIEGSVATDRGEYEFMSRRFQLTRGAVTFLGETPIDPLLQVAAEHEVRLPGREGFQIRVLLGGTPRNLTINLESTAQPPISQSDLLSYVAFGRDASSLLYSQGSALSGDGAGGVVGSVAGLATQQLTSVALEAAVSELERDVARELNLDVFRITPADLPAEVLSGDYTSVLEGVEIEAGRYVRPRLFVGAQSRAWRPGLRVEYRTPRGYIWTAAWQPRFIPPEPTLTEVDVRRVGVLGSFLFREWRF